MYKISPKTLQILEKEVAEFYFSNKDISRITVPELVDVSIQNRLKYDLNVFHTKSTIRSDSS